MKEGDKVAYIILNGVHSRNIKGLRIVDLPPIVTPKVRVVVEEIDGRSGDSVDILGYCAYDKTLEIAFGEGAKLDDIIDFFGSEGTVIFSNEEDKYYNYRILEPIEFQPNTKVTMHVQPFKYSLTEGVQQFSFEEQLIKFDYYSERKNGMLVTAEGNEILIRGEANEFGEFYMPISRLALAKGEYILNVFCQGGSLDGVDFKILDKVLDGKSLNSKCLVRDGETVKETVWVEEPAVYNGVKVSVPAGGRLDCRLSMSLCGSLEQKIVVMNRGNVKSRPKLTIYGLGTIDIDLNGKSVFKIDLKGDKYITIDSDKMEAYKDKDLKNRVVSGNYDDFALQPGRNIIGIRGNVSKIDIQDFSRWI